jgi:addiction module HigA family antidote
MSSMVACRERPDQLAPRLQHLPGVLLMRRQGDQRTQSALAGHSGDDSAQLTSPFHPGEHLAEELRILNMSASELARRIQVPTNRVTKILNGQRAITGDTALRLAHFFGTCADFWLNLQSVHELRVAEAKVGKMIHQLPTLKLEDRRRQQ